MSPVFVFVKVNGTVEAIWGNTKFVLVFLVIHDYDEHSSMLI